VANLAEILYLVSAEKAPTDELRPTDKNPAAARLV
jgi:hypothetical protein